MGRALETPSRKAQEAQDIDTLNELLMWELRAMTFIEDASRLADDHAHELAQLHLSHGRRVNMLKSRIIMMGGVPVFASRTRPQVVGGPSKLRALLDVCSQGLDYEARIAELSPLVASFVRTNILPEYRRARREATTLLNSID